MHPLIGLLIIVLAACASFGAFVALERRPRRPGLTLMLTAVSIALAAGVGFWDGKRLIPALLLLQAPGFAYFANLRRRQARAARDPQITPGPR
jgi:O-antigen ligase